MTCGFGEHPGVHAVVCRAGRVSSHAAQSCPRCAARAFALALRVSRSRHKRTRPYRPQTNGKVERNHRTLAREWAYTERLGQATMNGCCAGCVSWTATTTVDHTRR